MAIWARGDAHRVQVFCPMVMRVNLIALSFFSNSCRLISAETSSARVYIGCLFLLSILPRRVRDSQPQDKVWQRVEPKCRFGDHFQECQARREVLHQLLCSSSQFAQGQNRESPKHEVRELQRHGQSSRDSQPQDQSETVYTSSVGRYGADQQICRLRRLLQPVMPFLSCLFSLDTQQQCATRL